MAMVSLDPGCVLLAEIPMVDDRIAAAARGDRAAASAICRELLPRVRNLVRYLVRGDQLADDVAQEALIAVLRGLGSYRGEGKFESWVDRVVARSTFATLRRLRGAKAESIDQAAVEAAGDVGDDREPMGDALLRRKLAEVLDRVTNEQREALVLHFSAGLTVPEISELTGAPFETVRSRLRLGKQALREALGGDNARDE
jgi:RNA polymerase sigma-70 factor (ECF subfamily)